VLDISNPVSPSIKGSYVLGNCDCVDASGSLAYTTGTYYGFKIFRYTGAPPTSVNDWQRYE